MLIFSIKQRLVLMKFLMIQFLYKRTLSVIIFVYSLIRDYQRINKYVIAIDNSINLLIIFRLEASYCGCMPIAPNKLVYPEIYPPENLYNTSNQLIKMLYNWCRNPALFKKHRDKFFQCFSFDKFSAQHLVPKYLDKWKIQTNIQFLMSKGA